MKRITAAAIGGQDAGFGIIIITIIVTVAVTGITNMPGLLIIAGFMVRKIIGMQGFAQ